MNNEIELLTLQEVLDLLKIKRSSVYDWISKGNFPKPIKFGERYARWMKKDVLDWLEQKRLESKR